MLISTITQSSLFEKIRKEGMPAVSTAGFLLQAMKLEGEASAKVGYTVSRKMGGAVQRNRIKRRYRALVKAVMPERAVAGTAYVFIARKAALDRPFDKLKSDLVYALHQIAGTGKPRE